MPLPVGRSSPPKQAQHFNTMHALLALPSSSCLLRQLQQGNETQAPRQTQTATLLYTSRACHDAHCRINLEKDASKNML